LIWGWILHFGIGADLKKGGGVAENMYLILPGFPLAVELICPMAATADSYDNGRTNVPRFSLG